jgi:transcriptional regulator with XRE-family HTH domain
LSARYIGGIERANVSATVTVLGRVADALEVDATELIRSTRFKGQVKAAGDPGE